MLLGEADGEAAEEVVEALVPVWALTRIGRSKAVKARENFMVVSRDVIEY